MKYFLWVFFIFSATLNGQNLSKNLEISVQNLLNSSAGYSANLSFYVADKNGQLIYQYNGKQGLSTASTQKIFTAAAALELLGIDYRYTTSLAFDGEISSGKLNGNLWLTSNGDPTLGSWRYDGYKPEDFQQKILEKLKENGITRISGDLVIDDSYFDLQTTPGGWPWNDMGNYYGAGVWGINWRENQFDMSVRGSVIENTNIELPNAKLFSELKTGGSSDQSIIYSAPFSDFILINGMLPAGKTTTVSGATPNPPLTLGKEIQGFLEKNNIKIEGKIIAVSQQKIEGKKLGDFPKRNTILDYQSPPLEKIVYWFLRKSVNFYGETLIKTLGKEKKNNPNFESGVAVLKEFWKSKGIQSQMINFADGSGLSPQNYVSAQAEVQALLYAQKQKWFPNYLEGFPTQNNMKMKSGTMKNTKSFAGYHNNYVFAIILNNYQGSNISEALYKILNDLK